MAFSVGQFFSRVQFRLASVDNYAGHKQRTPNFKFALCRLTFKFEKLYLRFMFVMAVRLITDFFVYLHYTFYVTDG